ncbi:MAG: phosphocholine cytidylyltransferase family protein [Candidatus Kerfeldbacteria bacterium]|nr:phosphocholine cytidylyltransferase family protein [Candidatus Kerfeldbacteria bacterium]
MIAIILAAGNARRLLPQTAEIPKTLLRVGRQTIIEHILDALREERITHIVVVTGHGEASLKRMLNEYTVRFPEMRIQTVYNDVYETAGNIVSLKRAAHLMPEDDVIIINSDTIFVQSILHDLIAEIHPHAFSVDNKKILGDEEMKVVLNADGKITRIHKSIDPHSAFGEYIGLMKIGKNAAQSITDALQEVIAENNLLYYEDALQRAIDAYGIEFIAVPTHGRPAMEIDTQDDLDAAQELIEKF